MREKIDFMERAEATLDLLNSDFGNSGGVKGMIIACEIEKAYEEGFKEASEWKAKVEKLMKLINSMDILKKSLEPCYDKYHDKRWCSTCENQEDGADRYQARLQEEAKKIMEGV